MLIQVFKESVQGQRTTTCSTSSSSSSPESRLRHDVPHIEVTFDFDADGIINVTAADKSTGKSNKTVVTNDKYKGKPLLTGSSRSLLTLVAAEDEAEASRIQAKNGLESYTYSLRNSLTDVKAKLPGKSSEIAALEATIDETVKWLNESQQATKDEYEERRKEIETESTPLIKAFYEQGGAPGGFRGVGAGGAAEDGSSVEEVD